MSETKKVAPKNGTPLEFHCEGNTFDVGQFISGSTEIEQETSKVEEGGKESDAEKDAKGKKLDALERQIKKGVTMVRKSGESLKTIRDEQLYTSKGYSSFDLYCKANIKLSRTHIYRLINHVEICAVLGLKYLDVPEKLVRPFCQLKTVVMNGTDRTDSFDASLFKEIWEKACSAEKTGKKRKLPASSKVEELVKIEIEKKAGKINDSMVYVSTMKTAFVREALVDGIIEAVTNAHKMLSVVNELKDILNAGEVARLNEVCCNLINNPVKEKEVQKVS